MYQVEVVAIGEEVLSGATLNSNASFISRELLKAGFPVHRHTVLPDDPQVLLEGLKEALARSAVVICTGGLGPTLDDNTRQVAANLFSSEFAYIEEVAASLKQRYGAANSSLISLQDQATLPVKAKRLKNDLGTAQGLVFQDERGLLVLLPGVPVEMECMLTQEVIPYLNQLFPAKEKFFCLQVHLCGVSEAAVDPLLRQLKNKYQDVQFGIYPGSALLTVHVKMKTDDELSAMQALEPVQQEIKRSFARHLFEAPNGKIEEAVQKLFIDKKYTLSLAESCTGGAVANKLTSLPGSSQYFLGSIVAYSNEIKKTILKVSENTLSEKGAVSPELVKEMLNGVLALTQSDYGLAVTGIAGPSGGTTEKPVGTVWGAVGKRNSPPEVWQLPVRGSRKMIIERSVNLLLCRLLHIVENEK